MSDLKSKLPDLKELGEMTGKLFKDIKVSVCEIVTTYKKKRPETAEKKATPAAEKAPKKKAAPKPKSSAKSTTKSAGKDKA